MPSVTVSDGTVDEKGLVDGSGEVADPALNSDTSETTTGTFTIATGNDTLGTLEVKNSLGVFVDVTAGGTVQGANGVLTVTNTAGVYTWSYTLSDNLLSHTDTDPVIDGDSDRGVADQVAGEAFAVRVTDNEGDVSTETTLDITVNDDGPTANNDLATQTTENQAITIDVFANDVAGADGVNLTSGVAVATGPSQGTLVYNNNGSFTYTPNANAEGADSFSYTITDGDGDTSTATVSITLAADSVPSVTVSDGTVDEKGLVDGSGEVADPALNSDTSETTTGTFTIATGNDTLGALEVKNSLGVLVDVTAGGTVQGANGVLTVTNTAGVYTWSYTLSDNLLSHTDTDPVIDGDSDRGVADQVAGEAFAVRVTDNEGDVSTETTLDITVNDDGPTANNDLATQTTENQAITIDVFANDVAGADGVNLTSGVAVATGPSQGTLVYNNNGSFTYTPNANAEGADSFSYTITDGDGDTSTATVSITLAADSVPSVTVSDGTVDEKGLVDGSGEVADPALNSDTSETTTGTFTIATGNDTLGALEVKNSLGVFVDVTAGGTVQGANGVLTVTNTAGVYTWSYTLSDNLLSHTDTDPVIDGDSDRGVADQVAGEAFAVRVTDNEGDVSTETTLDITVNDDGPTANNDLATQTTENQAITIDVFANDVAGADGVNLTSGVAVATGPSQGTLVYNNNGSFTYTPNANAEGADSFSYTITDGDGDTSTATVSITLAADFGAERDGERRDG